jgi:hypothetical protein
LLQGEEWLRGRKVFAIFVHARNLCPIIAGTGRQLSVKK